MNKCENCDKAMSLNWGLRLCGKCIAERKQPTPRQHIECPNCGHIFTFDQARISEEQKMMMVLVGHGFSIRAVGRLTGLHPQSVKYRLSEAKKNRAVATPTNQDTKGDKDNG